MNGSAEDVYTAIFLTFALVFTIFIVAIGYFSMGKDVLCFKSNVLSRKNKGHDSIYLAIVLIILYIIYLSIIARRLWLQEFSFEWLDINFITLAIIMAIVSGRNLAQSLPKKSVRTKGISGIKWDKIVSYGWGENVLTLRVRRLGWIDRISWHLKPGEREKVDPILRHYLPGKEM